MTTSQNNKAEALFKRKEAQRLDGRKAIAEYEQVGQAVREKTARLRALRLARDGSEAKPAPAKPTRR